jgi:hypothetical protein
MKTLGGVGFGDVATDLQASGDADTIAGLNALHIFWQAAQAYNSSLPSDFTSFLQGLERALVPVSQADVLPGYTGGLHPAGTQDQVFTLQIQGIGNMCNTAGSGSFWDIFSSGEGTAHPMEDTQIQSAMQNLAAQGHGNLPTSLGMFAAVLQDAATQVSFLQAAWFAVEATAVQAGQAAQAVGEAALSTAQSILAYRNYILLGVAALAGLILYKKFVPSRGHGALVANPRRRKIRSF